MTTWHLWQFGGPAHFRLSHPARKQSGTRIDRLSNVRYHAKHERWIERICGAIARGFPAERAFVEQAEQAGEHTVFQHLPFLHRASRRCHAHYGREVVLGA